MFNNVNTPIRGLTTPGARTFWHSEGINREKKLHTKPAIPCFLMPLILFNTSDSVMAIISISGSPDIPRVTQKHPVLTRISCTSSKRSMPAQLLSSLKCFTMRIIFSTGWRHVVQPVFTFPSFPASCQSPVGRPCLEGPV